MSEIKPAASAYQLFQREKYGEVKATLEVRLYATVAGKGYPSSCFVVEKGVLHL